MLSCVDVQKIGAALALIFFLFGLDLSSTQEDADDRARSRRRFIALWEDRGQKAKIQG